jgi:hypothetical protein
MHNEIIKPGQYQDSPAQRTNGDQQCRSFLTNIEQNDIFHIYYPSKMHYADINVTRKQTQYER